MIDTMKLAISMMIRRAGLVLAMILLVIGGTRAADQKPPAKPGLRLPAGVKMIPNLEYANVNGHSLLLDLYLPENFDNPVPVILYVHGGGWEGGDKHDQLAVPLAAHGYAVASINYRLSQQAKFPAQLQDCKAAVRWLRAHSKFYGLDGAHVGAWGTSAGGHLAALLGTTGDVKEMEGTEGNLKYSSRVQAVCDWFGPVDLSKMADQAAKAGVPSKINHDAPDSPESKLLGGPVQQNKEKAARANPITYISKTDPPFLIMHGDKDGLVPLAQSQMLRDALKDAGVNVELKVIPGAGHGFGNREIFQQVNTFFNKHLKNPPPATQATRALQSSGG